MDHLFSYYQEKSYCLEEITLLINIFFCDRINFFSVFSRIRYCPHFVLCLCLSVRNATTFHEVVQLERLMARSIAYYQKYEPRKEFFWTGPGPDGRGLKSNFHCISYENWILLVFKEGNESCVDLDGEGVKRTRNQKWEESKVGGAKRGRG